MCIPNRVKESKLPHEYLTSILDYNPETGVFTWKVNRGRKVRVGDIAGTVVSPSGNVAIGIDGITHQAHRLAWYYMYGEWPNVIDHINRNRVDNRILNLRSVTHSENLKNKKIHSNNTSGHCGIYLHKRTGKWVAHIQHKGIYKYLGLYNTIDDAIKVRKNAELEYDFHSTHGNIKPIVSLAVAV